MSDAPPIDGIFLQAKKENSRPAFKTDISGGRFKLLGNILQVRDELPGQIAPVFLALPKCAGVLGNGKFKFLPFGFTHQQNRALVLSSRIGSIPVNDGSLNAATQHVLDLPSHLLTLIGAIPHITMLRIPKPRHVAGVDAGS